MISEDFCFSNQVLMVKTEKLIIRIVKDGNNYIALCFYLLPPSYSSNDCFVLNENLTVSLSFLQLPLLTIPINDFNFEIPYDNWWAPFMEYYEDARYAIWEILNWKEYWVK